MSAISGVVIFVESQKTPLELFHGFKFCDSNPLQQGCGNAQTIMNLIHALSLAQFLCHFCKESWIKLLQWARRILELSDGCMISLTVVLS